LIADFLHYAIHILFLAGIGLESQSPSTHLLDFLSHSVKLVIIRNEVANGDIRTGLCKR
jgi:hypothetical protein